MIVTPITVKGLWGTNEKKLHFFREVLRNAKDSLWDRALSFFEGRWICEMLHLVIPENTIICHQMMVILLQILYKTTAHGSIPGNRIAFLPD